MFDHPRQRHTRRVQLPRELGIDTRAIIIFAIVGVLALLIAVRLTCLPAGATWWQVWPFR